MAKQKTKKVRFLKSPTGAFKLAYNVGDITALPVEQAELLIESGYAEAVKAKS